MGTSEIILEYLRAIESHDLDRVASHYDPDVRVVEHPNKITPNGGTYDAAALRAAGERGKALLARETYNVRSMIVDGDRACVQSLWTGTLHDGRTMQAQICSVFELRDGKIWRQEQYDCFL